MARQRITVDRDQAMETMTGVGLEGGSAYYTDDGSINVLGELVAMENTPISSYIEVHVVVYSADGDILGRNYTNWSKFGLRQSFKLEIENEDSSLNPTRVKIYPSFG